MKERKRESESERGRESETGVCPGLPDFYSLTDASEASSSTSLSTSASFQVCAFAEKNREVVRVRESGGGGESGGESGGNSRPEPKRAKKILFGKHKKVFPVNLLSSDQAVSKNIVVVVRLIDEQT